MRLKRLVTVCLFVFCVAQTTLIAQASAFIFPSYQPVREQVAPLIEKEMARTGTVGFSIAVIDDQRIVWAEGFGWADKKNQVPAGPETVYQLASITKLFTTAAVMQLAEQEMLDIDKPLQRYLPSFSLKTRYPDTKPITARNIMTHHSGIPSDYFDIDLAKPLNQVTKSLQEQYVCFPPDVVYSYSNPAFIVLGDALSRISGRPYDQYIRENLLDPLEMKQSFFETETDRIVKFAKSYKDGKEQKLLPTAGVLPAAGLYSNTLDIAKFVKMIFAGGSTGTNRLLSKDTLAEMFRGQNDQVALDGSFRVGLGWMLSDSSIRYAGKTAGHDGHFNNYATNITLLPDMKVGVIVLANSSEADRMVTAISDEALKTLLEVKKGIKPPPEKPKYDIPKVKIPAQTLVDLSGYYGTHMGVISATAGNNKLIVRTPDFKVELIPREHGLFSVQYSVLGIFALQLKSFEDVYFSFDSIGGHKVVELNDNNGTFILGEKAPEPFLPDAWKDMAGTYELAGLKSELDLIPATIVCRIENQRIIIEMKNPRGAYPEIKTWGFIVQPVSPTEGVVVGLGRWKGDNVRRGLVDGIQHYYYAGLDYKKAADSKR
jgi:CubicO group peptidase (beta-lactamase class C family)